MNVGSLFAGIGGFDLGLERAGFHTSWFCEQDEFCQHILAKHWPGVPCYPDITQLRGADVEPTDVLCGGFPCQDISVAGKGEGLAGARSGLWSEYARLIGELRPRYVLVENVSALLGRGLGTVLGDLSALGYDAEWDCIPASAVGAPHRRDRVWLVAYPGGEGRREDAGSAYAHEGTDARRATEHDHVARGAGAQRLRAGERGTDMADAAAGVVGGEWWQRVRDVPSYAVAEEGRARSVFAGGGDRGGASGGAVAGGSGDAGEWWRVEPDVGRVAHGVPARVDRLRSLGNALVPQIAEWLGHRVMAYEQERAS